MAKIFINEEIVVRHGGYTLELSQAEAEVLAAILCKFGGSPTKSHRKYSQNVLNELYSAGIVYYTTAAYESLVGGGGMFRNVESLSERL